MLNDFSVAVVDTDSEETDKFDCDMQSADKSDLYESVAKSTADFQVSGASEFSQMIRCSFIFEFHLTSFYISFS